MLKNGFYNLLGALMRVAFTILSIPIIIRLIGLDEYGLWSLVSSVIGIVTLVEAGLSVSTTVFISRNISNNDSEGICETLTISMGAMLMLATSAALVIWLGAESLVNVFPRLGQLQQTVFVQAIQWSGLVIWFQLLQRVMIGVEQAYERYGLINLVNTLQSGLSSLGAVGIAWLGGRTVELIQWQVIISAAGLIAHGWINYILLRKVNLRLSWNNNRGWMIARYSFMTWATSLGSKIFSQCDRLIIGNLFDTEAVGVYSIITSVTSQINMFSSLPVQPLLPRLSNILEKQGESQLDLQRYLKQGLQVNSLVALGLGGSLLTLAPVIMNLLIPRGVSGEYILAFRIATVIYAIYSLNAVGYFVLFALDALKINIMAQILGGFLSILFIAIGAKFLGFLGAISGNSGYIVTGITTFIAMNKSNISTYSWLSWIRFPLIWFWFIILFNIIIDDKYFFSKMLIFLMQSFIILLWASKDILLEFVQKNYAKKQ